VILKLKTVIRTIVYGFVNFFIKPSKAIKHKSLLLIRLDGIGDYVLFRNFIKVLKNNKKYKNYSITLLGNSDWKTLSKELDGKYIDKFIWLNRGKFYSNLIYRYKKLQELASIGYEVILSPLYSREFFIADNIVNLITATHKIGSVGNFSNISKQKKKISDRYYTKLIQAKKNVTFEFYRNKEFFENFLNIKINIIKPSISFHCKKLKIQLPKKYAVLFIGGSENFKKWSIENFIRVANYLNNQYNYEIVLCGSPEDVVRANELQKHCNGNILNLTGKTSLVELLIIIYNSDLIFSNETFAPHFAVALDTKYIFVIHSGKYISRFCPYPKKISKNYCALYHPYISRNLLKQKLLEINDKLKIDLDINDISFDNVKNKIDLILKKNLYINKKKIT
jgi:ADP-heptose:LPS heptosyltransferase